MTTFSTIPSEDNILWSGMLSADSDSEVGVMGIPFDGATSSHSGAAGGPDGIRAVTYHLSESTEEGRILTDHVRIRDYGDLPPDLDWERYYATVEKRAKQVFAHPLALFLGGDHSVSIPLMKAFSNHTEGRIGVVQFDAHLDLAPEYDGHHWSHACTAARAIELPNIDSAHYAFAGIRSYLASELVMLKENPGFRVHTARDFYTRSAEAIVEDVIGQLSGVDAVYLSLDIDGLDPAYAREQGHQKPPGSRHGMLSSSSAASPMLCL